MSKWAKKNIKPIVLKPETHSSLFSIKSSIQTVQGYATTYDKVILMLIKEYHDKRKFQLEELNEVYHGN